MSTTPPDPESGTDDEAASGSRSPPAESDDESPSVEVEHAPPRFTQVVAVVAVLIGAALTVPFAVLAIPFGVAGVVIVATSVLLLHSRGWLTAGIGMVLFAALITGAYGAVPPELLLLGVGATLVAWDVGQHGMALGKQLGRQAPSRRNQIVHAAGSAIVIGIVSVLAYLVYLLGADGRPEPAVAIAVIGLILLAWTLRV